MNYQKLFNHMINEHGITLLESEMIEIINIVNEDHGSLNTNVKGWVAYDWHKHETRPKAYGKYFVHRKDGKVHWETWNGSGWAYNETVITHWQEIEPPCR